MSSTSFMTGCLKERNGLGVSVSVLGDPSKFGTVELSMMAQDDSEGLLIVAHILADLLECKSEDIELAVRKKVNINSL